MRATRRAEAGGGGGTVMFGDSIVAAEAIVTRRRDRTTDVVSVRTECLEGRCGDDVLAPRQRHGRRRRSRRSVIGDGDGRPDAEATEASSPTYGWWCITRRRSACPRRRCDYCPGTTCAWPCFVGAWSSTTPSPHGTTARPRGAATAADPRFAGRARCRLLGAASC